MEHWQQTFLRTDPWPTIPFATEQAASTFGIDSWVGVACLVAVAIVALWS